MSKNESWKEVVGLSQDVVSSDAPISGFSAGEEPTRRFPPKVKNAMNSHLFPTVGERFVLPSETTPDMALSVSELIARQKNGLPLLGQRVPVFDPEDDLPDLRTLDLAEIHDLKEQYAAQRDQIVSEANAEFKLKHEARMAKERQMMELWDAHQKLKDQSSDPKSTNIP